MKRISTIIGIFFVCTIMNGCNNVPRNFSHAEHLLNTDGSITRAFHSALYYPDQISLHADGYIIGLEKTEKATISRIGDVRVKELPEVGFPSAIDSAAKLDDPKIFYISHIIQRTGQKNCPLYDLYSQISPGRSQFSKADCELAVLAASESELQECSKVNIDSGADRRITQCAYARSWDALKKLRKSVGNSLKATTDGQAPYTHVVVITMGWNTPQEEAVRNFNSIMRNFSAAMNEQVRKKKINDIKINDMFRPLLIGVTWPSQWSSAWFDPAIKLFSFSSKAEDADQIGLSWLGALMHETIPGAIEDAGTKTPVIAIGHSFGSRAMSTAVCAGPVIYDAQPIQPTAKTAFLINYQGAFLSKRLFEKVSDHGMHYPQRCQNAQRLFLTASKFDHAITRPVWGAYAGSKAAYLNECSEINPQIECRVANSDGNLQSSDRKSARIVYIDADALIAENAHDTGGGAHSDIFRPEHGFLLRNMLELPKPSTD